MVVSKEMNEKDSSNPTPQEVRASSDRLDIHQSLSEWQKSLPNGRSQLNLDPPPEATDPRIFALD